MVVGKVLSKAQSRQTRRGYFFPLIFLSFCPLWITAVGSNSYNINVDQLLVLMSLYYLSLLRAFLDHTAVKAPGCADTLFAVVLWLQHSLSHSHIRSFIHFLGCALSLVHLFHFYSQIPHTIALTLLSEMECGNLLFLTAACNFCLPISLCEGNRHFSLVRVPDANGDGWWWEKTSSSHLFLPSHCQEGTGRQWSLFSHSHHIMGRRGDREMHFPLPMYSEGSLEVLRRSKGSLFIHLTLINSVTRGLGQYRDYCAK